MEKTMPLSPEERALLESVAAAKRYPVVRFELWSSRDRELRSTALNNVRLEAADEPMETVKARGDKLIRLDFGPAVTVASDYAVYGRSAVYALLCGMVEEGKGRPGFLFDTPHIRRGRAVLTARGRRFLEKTEQ